MYLGVVKRLWQGTREVVKRLWQGMHERLSKDCGRVYESCQEIMARYT